MTLLIESSQVVLGPREAEDVEGGSKAEGLEEDFY